MTRLWRAVLLAPLAVAFVSGTGAAQVRPELRSEFVNADRRRVEVGAGLTTTVGAYVRAAASVARDVWSASDSAAGQWRAESVVRFLMDPFAERRFGLSFGAGLGYRERPYLLVVTELEGPRTAVMRFAHLRPAIQLALGGGARAAIVLRQAVADRR